jgi:hypothetical protein
MWTKYNAVLLLAKETIRKLKLHYEEHQQLNSLHQECLDFVAQAKEKVSYLFANFGRILCTSSAKDLKIYCRLPSAKKFRTRFPN